MYNWRKLSDEQREELLRIRRSQRLPWHSPPHRCGDGSRYHITAACYEHAPILGRSPDRMREFERLLVDVAAKHNTHMIAWSVLPNHYHLLVKTRDILSLLAGIGQLHGRTSFSWNGKDDRRGRKVWCSALETAIKSDKHFYSTLNYIHNNPVHHGYVQNWDEWPFGNASQYLEEVGRQTAEGTWHQYPITGYGKDWDAPEI